MLSTQNPPTNRTEDVAESHPPPLCFGNPRTGPWPVQVAKPEHRPTTSMVSWKLTIEDDQGQKALMPLVGDEYTLGRDTTNAVHLPERNISRRHATLKLLGDARWSLVDHDSYNGVYVNGQRVAGEATLSHADLIQLGDYRISLQAEGDASTKIATIPPAAAVRPDRLVVLVGPNPGVEFPLDGGTEVAIGRAEECAVSINHPSVSRVHARVQKLSNGRYEVIDQGSANGLRVNGVDLARKVLEAGDMIELGDVKLRFLERGQQLRPGAADVSQQLTVAGGSSPDLPHSPLSGAPGAYAGDVSAPSGGSIATKVIIGVVVAAVAVGGLLALRPSDPATTTGDPKAPPSATPSASAVDDPAAKTLAEAQAAADASDYATMLAKLDELPPAFKDSKRVETSKLYAKWAEATIAKAKATKDTTEAKTLLGSVAQSDYAPLDLRNSAREALSKLPADKTAATATAAHSDPTPASTKSDPTPAKTASKTPSGDGGGIGVDDVLSEEKRKRAKAGLENKVASGKASTNEIRTLKALCQSDGDKACVARANAALAKGAE
jgi:ABC transport system ATP-binding/permease protein